MATIKHQAVLLPPTPTRKPSAVIDSANPNAEIERLKQDFANIVFADHPQLVQVSGVLVALDVEGNNHIARIDANQDMVEVHSTVVPATSPDFDGEDQMREMRLEFDDIFQDYATVMNQQPARCHVVQIWKEPEKEPRQLTLADIGKMLKD